MKMLGDWLKALGKIGLLVVGGITLFIVGSYLILCIFLLTGETTVKVVVDIPDSNNQLVIREYTDLHNGGMNFYLRRPWHSDQYLGRDWFADGTCPITNGDYELTWEENAVVVRFLFRRGQEGDIWREVRLDLSP